MLSRNSVLIKLILTLLLIGFVTTEALHSQNECGANFQKENSEVLNKKYKTLDSIFNNNPEYLADSFDYPVGKPNGKGYYNAQKFTVNNHLGDDWNGVGGGNSDLGDAIYAIADGYVIFSEDIGGGWGKVIRMIHHYKNKYFESVYAHCDSMIVKKGDLIKKGNKIATIGNANGRYWAHLHLEIRDRIFMDIGGGYGEDTSGYLDPTAFIKNH